jgi:UDP-N-acetylmuramate dehydrogenase
LDNSLEASDNVKQLLRRRNETQPIGVFSCGSVFKNPPNDYAARLIEASGLKGFKINDAEISTKHANFIINRGAAKANDVLTLIQHILEKVWQDHQVQLQHEVRLLGF